MVIVRDDVVAKYTLYNNILERFSIGRDRRVLLRAVLSKGRLCESLSFLIDANVGYTL
jgi:hypothetical protein